MASNPVGDASFEGEFTVKDGIPVKALSAAVQKGINKQFDKDFGQIVFGAAACAVGVLPGGNGPVVGSASIDNEDDAADCCRALQANLQSVGDTDFLSGEEATAALNPAVWQMIIQLAMFFLQNFKK